MASAIACIIGWPASKSLSPVIHNAAFKAAGLDWSYRAIDVAPADLAAAVAKLRATPISGANVTMPHKQAVMELLDDVAPRARRAGAVNTIVVDGARFVGENTDGDGFIRFLERDAGVAPGSLPVLLLGAGGAARSLVCALSDAGADVTVAARRDDAARAVAALAGARTCAWNETAAAASKAVLIVNATPVGMVNKDLPIDPGAIRAGHVVVDLIYAPASTPLLEAARARGATTHSGLGMLLHQAALSFEMWTGVPAPLGAMKTAVSAAL